MYVCAAPFAKNLTNLAKSMLISKESLPLCELCPTGKSKGSRIANILLQALHILLVY